MKLFDTLQRELNELEPVDQETFRFYCCGPTVYGPAHIGNFRTFVLQDVLRRTLEVGGIRTKHVRNITDVDDKTIRNALQEQLSLCDFTERWKNLFLEDCSNLNCLEPHLQPSAVEHIPQQIQMIEELVERGHAYLADDHSVYFKISSFPDYGKLSNLDSRELALGKTQAQRADSDEYEKEHVADFVLWKAHRLEDGPHYWESPWGNGRPGWHLECSAMIREYLGDSFDLHSGGEDLIFPHHENERAQSSCACGGLSDGGAFAAHWFHITHLMVEGEKMSKSLGNLYTLEDLKKKGATAMEVRYVLLSGHYRKQLNFTLDSLHAAREALHKLAQADQFLQERSEESDKVNYLEASALREELGEEFGGMKQAWERLNYDLNTPAALGAIFKSLKKIKGLSPLEAKQRRKALHVLLCALGLELPVLEEKEIPQKVQLLADQRWEAKCQKDWAQSDALREELLNLGWVVKDQANGYKLEPTS